MMRDGGPFGISDNLIETFARIRAFFNASF
jgi:hypothetical protein